MDTSLTDEHPPVSATRWGTLLHRLHRAFADPGTASFGSFRVKMRGYYFAPLVLLLPFLGGIPGFGNPSNEEIMAYRGGWAMGGIAGNADRETQQNVLEMMLAESPGYHDWMREGFDDGLKGRDARYDVPDDLFSED